MGSKPCDEYESNGNSIVLNDDNYEENSRSEDGSRKDLPLCTGKAENTPVQSVHNFPAIIPQASEPYVGMEFNSREEAREFYIAYGRRFGFTVRIHHNRRSRVSNQIIGQDFVCSKEGFRAKKYESRKDRVLPPPPVTREGCLAMIRLAVKDGGKWAITKFVKEHNHILMSPSKVPWRGSGKRLLSEVCFIFSLLTKRLKSIRPKKKMTKEQPYAVSCHHSGNI